MNIKMKITHQIFKASYTWCKNKKIKIKKKIKESKKSKLISFSWLKSLIKSYGNIKNLLNFFFLPVPLNITFFEVIELSFFFRLMHFFFINNRLRLLVNIDRWLAMPKSKKYLKKKYLIKNSTVVDKFKRLYNLKFEFFFYVQPRKFDIFYSSLMRKLINRHMYKGQRYLINRVLIMF